MSKTFPGCEDCWHQYHCGVSQMGFDYDPKTCPWNPDNDIEPTEQDYEALSDDR